MYYWKAICQSRHSNKEPEHLTSVDAKPGEARSCVNLQQSRRSTSYWLSFIHLGTKEKGDCSGNKMAALRKIVASWSGEIRSTSNSKIKPKLDKLHK